ncbi:hypothetical protein [Cupriavidus taiwanensis]|uniref:hypothetical protein n=1 Tax=Cupriavidus taiwanensis TaxID=164546 RepID=UPI000E103F9A|nr:hypothetical protein [Cupriavidus taiwanensis]SOY64722.1 conserved exported hypothetical protein [Cupriavidus taiwanensis]SOY64954.1 conserved exported hypothetical protein [Cupriavidus taiwanensis]SOY94099.1 conserved exported hypothetical protein [Cupriavidus taiwanensis]SOZ69319.1 conserved exported hypothetical protein [Cupriavidus taiwanensis]SOZ85740.1 conserved exported hypothetical protein [Cupriavidus taiwanensis]
MRQLVMPAALLSAIALLAACGGGDDGTSTTAPPTPPSDNQPAPAPAPAPVPEPAPEPAPAPEPKGELLPSLGAPQAGSTAAVGNGSEGIWVSFTTTTLVDSSGRFIQPRLLAVLRGTFQFSGSSWTLGPDTLYETGLARPVTGSGTITPGQRLDGNFVVPPSTDTNGLAGIYDSSNALAVDQAAIAGDWKQSGFAMHIDPAGHVAGTYTAGTRVCELQGTATLATPGSAKNLYAVRIFAQASTQPGTTGCALSTGIPHDGLAAIRLMPANGEIVVNSNTRYVRTLVMSASTGTGGFFATQMSKQPQYPQ